MHESSTMDAKSSNASEGAQPAGDRPGRLRVWMLRGALALGALLAGVALLAALALRDNPARPAVGERRVASSGDAEIHYFVAGPAGVATPVVVVPSYARSGSDFNELVLALGAAGHRTIAMQPRGVDGSTLPSFDVDLHTYAADLLAVLDAEQIDEPLIIGHAYGNRIARAFASDYPDRVSSLVLLAAGGERPTPEKTTAAIARALFSIWPERTRREAVRYAFFAEESAVPDYWVSGWHPLAGIAQARAMAETPMEEWSTGGSASILVLEPAEDAAAGGGGEALRARFPERVRVIHVEGAGHALLPEQPEIVRRAVLAELEAAQ
jgi:pimeloyl-ACP methyl ester carboxylesterase